VVRKYDGSIVGGCCLLLEGIVEGKWLISEIIGLLEGFYGGFGKGFGSRYGDFTVDLQLFTRRENLVRKSSGT